MLSFDLAARLAWLPLSFLSDFQGLNSNLISIIFAPSMPSMFRRRPVVALETRIDCRLYMLKIHENPILAKAVARPTAVHYILDPFTTAG